MIEHLDPLPDRGRDTSWVLYFVESIRKDMHREQVRSRIQARITSAEKQAEFNWKLGKARILLKDRGITGHALIAHLGYPSGTRLKKVLAIEDDSRSLTQYVWADPDVQYAEGLMELFEAGNQPNADKKALMIQYRKKGYVQSDVWLALGFGSNHREMKAVWDYDERG